MYAGVSISTHAMTTCCNSTPSCPTLCQRTTCCATTAISQPYTESTLTLTDATSVAFAPAVRVYAPCTVAVALVWSGSLQYVAGEGQAAAVVVDVTLQYSNTLLPSVVNTQAVPVTVTLADGYYVPVATSLDVTLAPGTYLVSVALAFNGAPQADTTIAASGTLNAVVTRSTSSAACGGCC